MSKDAKLAVLSQIAALAKSAIKKGMKPDAEGEECPVCHQEPCECDEAEVEVGASGLGDPDDDYEDPDDGSLKAKLIRFKKKLGKPAVE